GLFFTGIETGVKEFRDRYDVASFTIQMVAAALLAIALYSVAFVAGHFLAAQAPTLAVLRGRGWSRRRVWWLLSLQFALLALAAIPVGLATAWLLSRWLGSLVFGGATPATSGGPLSVALPALALARLAVAALRLLPVAAWAVRRLSRGLPGALAAWQLERQPVQHARLAGLMSFAVAVGLFSSIYAATDRANTADR